MRFFAAFESRGAINLTVGDRGNTRDQPSRNVDHTGEIVNWAPPALPAAARAPRAAAPPSSEMNSRRLMGLSPPVIEVITFWGLRLLCITAGFCGRSCD